MITRDDFVKLWKEFWPAPRDWADAKEIANGTSSLILWINWIVNAQVSAAMLRVVFRQLADSADSKAPSLHVARRAYAQRMARTSGDVSDGTTVRQNRCQDCEGTGWVHTVWVRGERGEYRMLRPDANEQNETAHVRVMRCKCKSPGIPDNVWACRFPPGLAVDRFSRWVRGEAAPPTLDGPMAEAMDRILARMQEGGDFRAVIPEAPGIEDPEPAELPF